MITGLHSYSYVPACDRQTDERTATGHNSANDEVLYLYCHADVFMRFVSGIVIALQYSTASRG